MIPIPTSEMLFSLLLIVLLVLLFLPAIFELKRPKDAGPRRIANIMLNDFAVEKTELQSFMFALENIEKEEFAGRHFETFEMPTRSPIFALVNIEI